MTKEQILIQRMSEGYYSGKGVDTMTLCKITPAYSQRFGEWQTKCKAIKIDKMKRSDGTYTYHLRTDPMAIDWDRMTAKMPEKRIVRAGKKIEEPELQENLFNV